MRKKQLLLTLMLLLASLTGVYAGNGSLSISNIKNVVPGYSGSFDIVLTGSDVMYAAYQYDLTLPDGLTYTGYSDGPMISSHVTMASVQGTQIRRFTSAANPTAAFTAMNGVLATIYFSVSSTYDPAQSNVTFTNIHFSDASAHDYAPSSETPSVPLSGGVTLDETSTMVSGDLTGVSVTVNRALKADVWNTVCLPFALSADMVTETFGNDVEVAELSEVNYTQTEIDGDYEVTAIDVIFSPVTTMTAHHPYIVKVTSDMSTFTVNNVNVEPLNGSPEYNVGTETKPKKFIGNYNETFTIPDGGLFLSNNQFKYSTGSSKLRGFRAYFNFDKKLYNYKGASARAVNFIVDDGTTGVNDVRCKMSDIRGVVFNLQGQRVARPVKGLYIQNGKKVIVK
jgi:flagellar hook-associated protein FlgK